MAGMQLAGLASGMDWKSTVEQLMRLERVPQDRLKARQTQSGDKQAALDKVKAAVSTLQTAASNLDLGTLTSGPRTSKITSSLALKSTAIPVAFEGEFDASGTMISPKSDAGKAVASGLFGPSSGVYYTVSGDGVAPGTIVTGGYDPITEQLTIDPAADPGAPGSTVWLTFNYSGSGYETTTVPLTDPGTVTSEEGASIGSYEVRVLEPATEPIIYGCNNGLVPDWGLAGDGLQYERLTLSDYGVYENDTVTVNGTQYTITATDLALSAEDFLVARGGTVINTNSADRDMDGRLDISFSNGTNVPFLGNSSDSGDVLEKLGISFSAMDGNAAVYQQKAPTEALLKLKLSSFGAVSGYIKINGIQINYSDTDTLGSLISSVNSSDAGVMAELDADRRRLVLRGTTVGGGRISLDDNGGVIGGVLSKLGVSATSQLNVTAQSGWNPRDGDSPYKLSDRNTYFKTGSPMTYSLIRNGKPVGSPGSSTTLVDGTTVGTFTAPGNTVDLSVHGFGKTKLSVSQAGTYKFQVSGVENGGRDKFDALIKAYNDLRTQVQDVTKVTVGADGKVTTAILSGNRDLVNLLSTVRSRLFSVVKDPGSLYSNFSSSYDRLERLGISFDRNGVLSVANSAKLTEALRDYPSRVSALFNSGASSLTASGTFGNTYITATSVSNLAVGQVLTATGIPSGAKVGAINSSTLQVDLVDDSGNPVSLTGDLSAAKVYLPVENQGLSVRLNGLISNLLDTSSSTPGLFATSTSAITNEKKMLQRQIELMDRQLAARQAALERSFVAMEKAQSKSQSMLSQLTNAFQKPS